MGLMGPAAAYWGDSIYIAEDADTGSIEPEFTASSGWKIGGYGGPISTSIDASDPRFLDVTIDDAWHTSEWRCDFTITNNGTVPVRIEAPHITVDQVQKWLLVWSWWEDAVIVTCSMDSETVLDPGQFIHEHLNMKMNTAQNGPYDFKVSFDTEQWNGGSWQDELQINGTVYGHEVF